MGLFGGGNGSWTVQCNADSRFNMTGRASGNFGAQKTINDAILAKQKELGLTHAYPVDTPARLS